MTHIQNKFQLGDRIYVTGNDTTEMGITGTVVVDQEMCIGEWEMQEWEGDALIVHVQLDRAGHNTLWIDIDELELVPSTLPHVGDRVEVNATGINHEMATILPNDEGQYIDGLISNEITVCLHFDNCGKSVLLVDQWIDLEDITIL